MSLFSFLKPSKRDSTPSFDLTDDDIQAVVNQSRLNESAGHCRSGETCDLATAELKRRVINGNPHKGEGGLADSWARCSFKDLILMGADPNACDEKGSPLLCHAVAQLDKDMVGALLCAGARPDKPDANGNGALIALIVDTAQILRFCKSAYARAGVQADMLQIAQTLLTICPDQALARAGSFTVLQGSVGLSTELTALLLAAGADPREPMNDGSQRNTLDILREIAVNSRFPEEDAATEALLVAAIARLNAEPSEAA
jgi:hypothetical protein